MNQKRRIQAGSIALYVLAVLLLCYGAYMAFSAYTYVADYYGYQGTDITANLGEAFQYVISQSCLYICFSIVFYVMGLLLQKLNDLHDFLPREYLRPKEVEEQDVEIAEDAVGRRWQRKNRSQMAREPKNRHKNSRYDPDEGLPAVFSIDQGRSFRSLSVYDQAFFSK